MLELKSIRNYIVINKLSELKEAKENILCSFIIKENKATITIWKRFLSTWVKETYNLFNENTEDDFETTGLKAYQEFYKYCGKEEVEKMKNILPNIELWESEEQLHFFNIDYVGEKIYKDIYIYDANSSFTYGVLELPDDFNLLKLYMIDLYEKKKNANTKYLRQKYKNLQNYLIGYFARVKDFVSLRSKIIYNSNENIRRKMYEIRKNGGIVYISNTDSIITDNIGHKIMQKYVGKEIGEFKLEKVSNRLYYNSSNSYQVGDKLVWSGLGYFAKRHTDMFKEEFGSQSGSLIEQYDFVLNNNDENIKLCRVRYGKIIVVVKNKSGEIIKRYLYKLGD